MNELFEIIRKRGILNGKMEIIDDIEKWVDQNISDVEYGYFDGFLKYLNKLREEL